MTIGELDTGVDSGASSAVAPLPPSRRIRHSRVPKLVAFLSDVLAIGASMALASLVVGGRHGGDELLLALAAVPLWAWCFVRGRLYEARRVTSRAQEFHGVARAATMSVLLMGCLAYVFELDVARGWLALVLVFSIALIGLERELARRVFLRFRARGHLVRRVIVVGANDEGLAFAEMLHDVPSFGYEIAGFVDDGVTSLPGWPVLGTTAHAVEIAQRVGATGAIVATSALDLPTFNRVARQLVDARLDVEVSSNLQDIAPQRLWVRPLGRFPVVCLEPTRHDGWRALAKRGFDVAASAVGLAVGAPVMAAMVVAIRLDTPGAAVFRQERVGRDGRPFTMYKFRTMVADAETRRDDLEGAHDGAGPLFKLRDDERVTRVGRFLRRSSLDELAQLWNVLRGDMSLVGPRPALPAETAAWEPELFQRLRVRPGLTGMWQISGRSNASFEEYVRLDLFYVDNWSLVTDLSILVRTIPVVLRGHGAY